MDVVRKVLDKLVVDRRDREMGRVDGIELQAREGQPPRIAAILIGPAALGHRLHPRLGGWVHRLEAALGLAGGRPVRIAFADVESVGATVTVRETAESTAALAVEQRLRGWIRSLPGAR